MMCWREFILTLSLTVVSLFLMRFERKKIIIISPPCNTAHIENDDREKLFFLKSIYLLVGRQLSCSER